MSMQIVERIQNGVTFLAAESIEAAGRVAHGFSTRLGGVSQGMWDSLNLGVSRGDDPDHVRENYRRFLTAIGADGQVIAMSHQVHGGEVHTVTTADLRTDPYDKVEYEADGLMTDLPGVTLLVYSADCIPVLFYDPVRRVAAAVHAGWRGTAAGIVDNAVARMKDVYHSRPEDILAAIGPGVCSSCFETHEDVPNAMRAALGDEVSKFVVSLGGGKCKVDLKGINALRLRRCGVMTTNIDISPDCTMCAHEKYWSHRYTRGERGSQAAFLSLPEGGL